MLTSSIVGIVVVTSIIRARCENTAWIDIIAWPSRWLYYVSQGGAWGPTFSACVGLKNKIDVSNLSFWRSAKRCINTTFWIVESDHCNKALTRTEVYMRRVRSEQQHWGRPES